MTVGERIKSARIAAKLTQEELGKKIGVNKEAIHKYEKGLVENIPLPKFQALAEALDVEASWLAGWGEAEQVKEEHAEANPVTRIYNRLNANGKQEYVRYGNYLCSLDEYMASDTEPEPVEYIRHYFTAAAAGYAAPIEGSDFELIPKDKNTPSNADFCIDIDGDSMEPYIHNGSRVYVQRDISNLREFDVGIFFVDGDMFCKQWCVDQDGTLCLLSANPHRADANINIPRGSGRNAVCFGKVILPKRLPRPIYY